MKRSTFFETDLDSMATVDLAPVPSYRKTADSNWKYNKSVSFHVTLVVFIFLLNIMQTYFGLLVYPIEKIYQYFRPVLVLLMGKIL